MELTEADYEQILFVFILIFSDVKVEWMFEGLEF